MEVSNKNCFIYFEPFEDECLYSWNIRMLRSYAEENKLSKSTLEYIKLMYGNNITCIDLYFQEGIDHLIRKIDSSNSCKWETAENVINSMTVIPFYRSFLNEKEFPRYDKLSNQALYYALGRRIGLLQDCYHIEGIRHIKYCPKCYKEVGVRYFNIEHQIPGNFMCSEHKVPLRYITYVPSYEFDAYDFIDCAPSYELTQEECSSAFRIARMIHQIFGEGLLCSLDELKKKIRSRLRSLNILNSNFAFFDYVSFLNGLNYDIYFRYVDKEKIIFNLIYNNSLIINPIFYLIMIDYLFQDLQSFYQYKIEFEHGSIKRKYRVEEDNRNFYSVDFYRESMSDEYRRHYTIMGETSCSLIIKHNKCGRYFSIDRRFSDIHPCPYCFNNGIDNMQTNYDQKDSDVLEIDDDPCYTFYLTAGEYAALHNKTIQQIKIFLKSGRIPNALRVEFGKWLIPCDTEYPKRKS